MKKLFLLLLSASIVFSSCEDYGNKVTINDKSEVYYKGDGVSETEAKELGDFLLKQGYFTTTDDRSVQLTKDGDGYIVKFVVNEEKLMQDEETAMLGFKVWQMWIQDNVFKGAKTRLVLADSEMNDVKPVGELTAQEKAELTGDESVLSQTPADSIGSDASLNIEASQIDSTNK
jgi:hypothetical protein